MHREMVLFSIARVDCPGVFLDSKSQILMRCQCNRLSTATTFAVAHV